MYFLSMMTSLNGLKSRLELKLLLEPKLWPVVKKSCKWGSAAACRPSHSDQISTHYSMCTFTSREVVAVVSDDKMNPVKNFRNFSDKKWTFESCLKNLMIKNGVYKYQWLFSVIFGDYSTSRPKPKRSTFPHLCSESKTHFL